MVSGGVNSFKCGAKSARIKIEVDPWPWYLGCWDAIGDLYQEEFGIMV